MMKPSKRFILIGPTASGKTSWAVDFFEKTNVEILNIDSCQIYKELSIGSAKPTLIEQNRLKHHMVDLISIKDEYNVGRYLEQVERIEQNLFQKQIKPIYVGGSMLYVDRLMKGLADIPTIPDNVLQEINEKYINQGLSSLWDELLTLDPSYIKLLHPNDKVRIMRALSVLKYTNKPLYSYWQSSENKYDINLAMILPNCRHDLLEKVKKRTKFMLDQGLVDEVKFWFDGSIKPPYPALMSIGYKQVWSYLLSDIKTLDELEAAIVQETMRYIKQQITWMKRWRNKASVVVEDVSQPQLIEWGKSIYE